MNAKLVFEDLFTLQQNLKWEFRNNETEIDVARLRRIILDTFYEAGKFLKLNENHYFDDCSIEIRLLMRGLPENRTLAYFDLLHLTAESKTFSFKLYADILFPLLISDNFNYLKTIWIHEIMHMIDYRELLQNLKIYKDKLQSTFSTNPSYSLNKVRQDKHIILLQLIMKYRAEGIATLVEYISGGRIHHLAARETAISQFNSIVTGALTLIKSIDYKSSIYSEFYERLDHSYYQIGAGVVLHGLLKKHQGNAELEKAGECLLNNSSTEQLSKDIVIDYIRSFDSLDFIKYCFDQDWLYEKLSELTFAYAESLNVQKGFFQILDRIKINMDRSGFVALMQNLIEVPLPIELMEEALNEQVNNKPCPHELHELANVLYSNLMKNHSDEVSFWALSCIPPA